MNFNVRLEIPSANQGLEGTLYTISFVVSMSNIILSDVTAQCRESCKAWILVHERMRLI